MKSSTSLKGRLMWVFTSPQARSTITCAGGGGGGDLSQQASRSHSSTKNSHSPVGLTAGSGAAAEGARRPGGRDWPPPPLLQCGCSGRQTQ